MFSQRTVAQALFTDPCIHEGCLSDVSLSLLKVILGLSRPAKLSPKLAFSLQLLGGGRSVPFQLLFQEYPSQILDIYGEKLYPKTV